MMKRKWWKHPEMVLFYGALGGIVGVVFGFIICPITQQWAISNPAAADGFQSAYSGVSGVFLAATMAIFDAALGGITGCLLVHLYGKYRFAASFGFVILGILAAVLSALQGLSFARGFGREAALAVFGIYFLWSLLLIFGGIYLIAKDVNSGKSELQ